MVIGKQIKHYRLEKGWSQEELAEALLVSRQTISNWERGANYPDIENLLRFCQIFEIGLEQLIKEDEGELEQITHQADYDQYEKDTHWMILYLVLALLIGVPAMLYLGWYGWGLFFLLWGLSVRFAYRVEAFKKRHHLRTYRELLAYDEKRSLTNKEEIAESAKAPYQKVMIVVGFSLICACLAVFVVLLCLWLFPLS